MTILEILVAVIAVAVVALLAWCEDQRSLALADVDPSGDWLTPADLIRCGIVNADGTVIGTDLTPLQWWNTVGPGAPDVSAADLERAWHECLRSDAMSGIAAGAPYYQRRHREYLAAHYRACNTECDSAVPGRDECGQPSGQEAISPHSVSGLPRGGGPGVRVAPDPGATPSDRASGEATGHD